MEARDGGISERLEFKKNEELRNDFRRLANTFTIGADDIIVPLVTGNKELSLQCSTAGEVVDVDDPGVQEESVELSKETLREYMTSQVFKTHCW